MSGGNKPYYDRDDLDEDEKNLFDAMVLEEMEKLEKQFDASSLAERRDHSQPQLQLNSSGGDGGRDARYERSLNNRNRPYSHSEQPQQLQHYAPDFSANESIASRHGEPARRAPRAAVQAEEYPRPDKSNNGMSFSPEKSNAEKRLAQQEYARLLEEGSRVPVSPSGLQAVRRARREESPPESRHESNISRIGATDLTLVSASQKRAQQAKYASQLAEGSSRPQSFRDQDPYKAHDSHGPRRRQSEITIEPVNVISDIGQGSQMMKDSKKLQQAEYAQQLQSQQQHKQRHDNSPSSPYVSDTPKRQSSASANPYSSRRNENGYDNGSPPSKNSVANFGPDPNAEAARKRDMKVAYARQLQEQQSFRPSVPGNGRDNGRSAYREPTQAPQRAGGDWGADESKDDRGNVLNAAAMKRLQQRQYHDEITMAAAAPPIHSERAPLKGSSESRQQQRMHADGFDSRNNGPGTGLQLQIGGDSSFLSNADAERLETRSRKVEQQQQYAKQLSDDATVNEVPRHSANGGRSSLSQRSGSGSVYGNSRNDGSPKGGDDTRGGMFGNISERDQSAASIHTKRAAQAEYFQQLQEGQRSDNVAPSSRITLYRNREQKERDVPSIGRREDREDTDSRNSRPHSEYSDHGDSSGYQGPGYGQRRKSVEQEVQSARRREQDEYARALMSDSEVAPIADSYTAQRRSHHEREGPGSRGDRDESHYMPSQHDRQHERQPERQYERQAERQQERYSERETEREPEMRSESRSEKFRPNEGENRYQEREERQRPRYQEREEDSRYQARESPNDQPRYQERERSSGYDQQQRIPSAGADRGRADSRSDPRSDNYSYASNKDGQGGYYDDEASEPPRDSQRRVQDPSPYADRGSDRGSSSYEPPSPGQQYKREHLFGADSGTVSRQQGSHFQPENADTRAGNVPRSKTEDFRGRGRSSGGGASTISLYG